MKMELTDEKRKGYVVCALMILTLFDRFHASCFMVWAVLISPVSC